MPPPASYELDCARTVPRRERRPDGSVALHPGSTRYFVYQPTGGWNNQLLNLLCALDMARLLNRTLIVPPFSWARRRGASKVSVARLIDLRDNVIRDKEEVIQTVWLPVVTEYGEVHVLALEADGTDGLFDVERHEETE